MKSSGNVEHWICNPTENAAEEKQKRIYSIVAQTVLAPIEEVSDTLLPRRLEGTVTIVQPKGRIVAQHGHVVSKVRETMLKRQLEEELRKVSKRGALKLVQKEFEPITTIVLGARDSHELYHVRGLLRSANLKVHTFYDTDQPDYGDPSYKVMTAIATEPLYPADVVGILDYLPLLWKEEVNL